MQSEAQPLIRKQWRLTILLFRRMEFDVQLVCHFCNALIDQGHLGHHAKVEQANKHFLWETCHSHMVGPPNFQVPTEDERSDVRPNHEIMMTFCSVFRCLQLSHHDEIRYSTAVSFLLMDQSIIPRQCRQTILLGYFPISCMVKPHLSP